MTFKIKKATADETEKMLSFLNDLDTDKKEDVETFLFDDMEIYTDNGRTRSQKVWGEETLVPEPDLFVEVAKTAPNAEWSVKSFRVNETGGYGQTYLEADYTGNILKYRLMSYVDIDSFSSIVEYTYDLYCDETPDKEQMDQEEFEDTFDYGQFCKFYNPDESITQENFEKLKEEDASIFVTEDNDASLIGWWEEQEIPIA